MTYASRRVVQPLLPVSPRAPEGSDGRRPNQGRVLMQSHALKASASAVLLGLLWAPPASADTFSFSTGPVTNFIATATRPASSGKFEIESADDFVLTQSTSITSATFTGLLTGGATIANIGQVVVEIYRVFPNDSDVGRTSGPPTFSTPQ